MISNDRGSAPVAVPAASSVVARGLDALTFHEMELFVKDLESRPTERLIRDLMQLAALSATKVSLVSYVISTRFKQADSEARNQMRESVASVVESLSNGERRKRVLAILDRLV